MAAPQIDSKLPNVGTTIFTVMSKMAQDNNAINLSQGFPDYQVPKGLLDAMQKYLHGNYNQYPPMAGVPYLREQIAAKTSRLYAAAVDIEDEITVTSGATEALFVAIQTVVRPGDEVIVLDPCYDSYEPGITLAGGKTIHVPLAADFSLDAERLKDAMSDKTRLIMLNTPHNPSGSVLSLDELHTLSDLVENRHIFLISDEVYEHMVYDNAQHHSLVSLPALRDRTFVISSFGKTYHATGWKVAYCLAPPSLTAEFRKIHQFVTFTTHTPTQWALADYMEHHPEHFEELPRFYEQKRDLFLDAMAQSRFDMRPSAGTYFQLANYSALSSEPDQRFVEYLTRDVGVAAIPVSVFYDSPPNKRLIRFCFCKDDTTLESAAERLSAL